ncbi:MAG: ammonium transporter [Actinobacteria bacterium]|nr:ammonium transporter [Actinomycetota bacterium]
MNTGDTAWMLVATALVLFMTPGLAFFYGGMVRAKNVLGMIMQNMFAMGLIAVIWVLGAFSLAFGNFGDGGWLGGFHYLGMAHVGEAPALGLTIPLVLFAAYQMTFAVITPALITGATADRMKFSAYAVFIAAWMVLVYAPVAHWVFAGGWLAARGALDFAGGAVVHMNAGAAALAVILVLGKRKGWPKERMHPHSLPLTMIGTGILWFGWFGFNAGSALAANGVAAQATMNTFVATSAAMLGWLLVERIKDGHATTLGAASGAVAGLVAITPCAGFVGTLAAVGIGFATGMICVFAIGLKERFGFDDALDVIGVHLVGGLAGTLMLGLFASKAVNSAGRNGLFLGGGAGLLGEQALAAAITIGFSFVVSFIIAKVIDATMGLRVDEQTEVEGLDLALHAETAYTFGEFGSMGRL